MMKRILYISNYQRGLGGINAQVDLLSKHISAEGYVANIFSTKGNPLKRIWLFLKLLFVARKYDMLHMHGCSDWGMVPVVYGVIAGKIWRKRIIVTYHGGGADDYFARHGAFARRWLRRADKVIVLSGFLKKVFNEYDIPCVVIPNVVTLREGIYQPKKTIAPRFISVRHLTELYRIDLIIKAFEQVVKHYPEATLDILGQGECRAELEEYVKNKVESGQLKVESVRFVGQVPNEKIYDYLRANDIMLSAPRIDNMPVSLLEAMNAGGLVISSNVGGVPYMIEHGRTGLLFGGTKTQINTASADINQKKINENTESTAYAASSVIANQSANEQDSLQPNCQSLSTDANELHLSDSSQKIVSLHSTSKNAENDLAEALAEQMIWALEHQVESVRMIEAAHEEVQKYSWHNIKKLLLPLYEQV